MHTRYPHVKYLTRRPLIGELPCTQVERGFRRMNDHKADDGSGAEEARGPRTSVVLGISLGVLALIVGAGIGINRFIAPGSSDSVEGPDTTVDETINVEPVDDPSATRLFNRTTDSGIDIRVHLTEDDAFGFGQGGGDELPARCRIKGTVMATMVSAESVAQNQLPITEVVSDKPSASMATGGFIEASPLVGIVSQVADDITLVRLTLGGVSSDSMEPVGGIVALAVEPPPPPPGVQDTVNDQGLNQFPFGIDTRTIAIEYLHADGTSERLGERDLNQGLAIWNDPVCNGGINIEGEVTEATEVPPATLPKPGVFQPDDPAAARAEIELAFTSLYENIEDDDAIFQYVDDPSGLDLLMDDVLKGEFKNGYRKMSAEIVDLIYFSPVEASFMYTLDLDPLLGPENFDNDWFRLFGRARLVDGTWRITRTTICRDIEMSGTQCTV
jgi:hypothetical protein